MGRSLIFAVIIFVVGAFGVVWLHGEYNRYGVVTTEGRAIQYDKKTGQTWMFRFYEKRPHFNLPARRNK